ncbi:sodium- and chloride-dependent GABA transporter 2-like [Dermatophagoides pteronyssinus]|uniref:Transporter n=1 Tax=Dermatophagoides pteronyssinus TaxID=6956 RepID=A0A6P6Y3G9_DERPT|nr:sodium- and chloride-dependent GABA transporter 2-like [Dermatophagoides pteronyssinus]
MTNDETGTNNKNVVHLNGTSARYTNGQPPDPTTTTTTTTTSMAMTNTEKLPENYRPREQWANKLEFVFACMAYAIGLGNVWRFPYLCYKNGGGAFFIPYFIFLVCGAAPILFLEVAIGQYFRQGGITVWREICPLFRGIGFGTVTISFILNCYYIVVIAWALLYLYYSLRGDLLWASCDNDWNTDRCWTQSMNTTPGNGSVNSVIEFWEHKILQISPGIDQPNGFQWELVLTLAIAWIICFFCIWKGVKSTGKAVYVTAIFPYIVITALFIRGITLPGASEGIKFYLYPDFSRLLDSQVWMDAGTQIFFSYAIALGCMVALGSYNTFNNNFYYQLLFLTGANSGTSIYCGFVIFSILGYMAHEQHLNISDVAESGPGLAFIAYPRAVAMMPGSSFWAVMFFVMILLLGLGSQFVGVEGFVTAMVDLFPQYLRIGKRREWFISGVCFVSFLIGLSMVTRGGMYVFQLFDYYGASGMCLLWYCFFQAIVVGWIYKSEKLYDNIEKMIGFRIPKFFHYCWKYITPVVIGATFAFYLATYKSIKYNGTYEYPWWGIVFGWILALTSILQLPISILYFWFTAPNIPKKWTYLITGNQNLDHATPHRNFNGNDNNNNMNGKMKDIEIGS